MRAQLNEPTLLQQALGAEFTLVRPFDWTLTELTLHRSAADFNLQLQALKVTR